MAVTSLSRILLSNKENPLRVFATTRARKRTAAPARFSSSSSSSKNEPRFSNRTKRDLWILAAGICSSLGYFLVHKDNDWEQEVRAVQSKLIKSLSPPQQHSADCNANRHGQSTTGNAPNKPPLPVQRYIEKVIIQSSSVSCQPKHDAWIVTAHQSGEFWTSQRWFPFSSRGFLADRTPHPFEATLTAAASPTKPGFVWNAKTTLWGLSNNILEYSYEENDSVGEKGKIRSEGNVVTKVWGKYPLIQIHEEDPYFLFWLAMTPLYPLVFLPCSHEQEQLFKWIDDSNGSLMSNTASNNHLMFAKAQLQSQINGTDTTYLAEFFFREQDGLLHRIKVLLPSGPHSENEKTQNYWQATFENYEEYVVEQQGEKMFRILAPSSIEIGKCEDDQFRLHFRVHNHRLNYK